VAEKALSQEPAPNATLRALLISLFSEPGQWIDLVDTQECLTPQGDTLRASVTSTFLIAGRDMSTIPLTEIVRWLARCGGLTPDSVPRVEAYILRLLSKEAFNPAALTGQQQMKKAVTRATKRARTNASATIVTADQLDHELAAAQPPSPPPDPATSAAWHQDNGLAMPDHLSTEPHTTVQEAGPSTKATPTEPAGTPQPDPQPPPAPHTNVPMEDVEEIDEWVPIS
jgi:hypothetical protein